MGRINNLKKVELFCVDKCIELSFVKDKEFNYIHCSSDFQRILKLKNEDSIIGKSDCDLPWQDPTAEIHFKMDEITKDSRKKQINAVNYIVDCDEVNNDYNLAYLVVGYRKPIFNKHGRFNGIRGTYLSIVNMAQSEIDECLQMNKKSRYYLGDSEFEEYLTPKEARFLFYWLNMPKKSIATIGLFIQLTPSTCYSYSKIIRQKLHSNKNESITYAVNRTAFYDNFRCKK